MKPVWNDGFGMTGVFLSVPIYDWCAPLSQPSSCMLVNHVPSQQSFKEEYKPRKWGATDHRKETQTAVVWSCFPFIRSSQNHLARHSERGKKTRQTEEEVGSQYQETDRPGVRQSQGAVENRKEWRKLVAKSSVVPKRSSRLLNRWDDLNMDHIKTRTVNTDWS